MSARAFSPRRHNSGHNKRFWLAFCLLVLSACATTRPSVNLPDLSSWQLRQSALGVVKDWSFKGRIAVKAGDEGFNAKFNWNQTGNDFVATVGGPLGIGSVRVEGDGRTVVLTDKDGLRTILVDAETELFYRYGWTIPIASLRYWALGIPDPSLPAETSLDDSGRLHRLRQSNWNVEISRYRAAAGQDMPRTLTATNPDTRVRMVIDRWLFFER